MTLISDLHETIREHRQAMDRIRADAPMYGLLFCSVAATLQLVLLPIAIVMDVAGALLWHPLERLWRSVPYLARRPVEEWVERILRVVLLAVPLVLILLFLALMVAGWFGL